MTRAIACALVAAAACHPARPPSTPVRTPPPSAPVVVTAPQEPSATPAPPSASPARDLEAELGEHGRAIYACVERQLDEHPLLRGHLTADVDVDADGHVADVEIPESTFPGDETSACVVAAWRAVRIAPLPARTTVRTQLAWQPGGECEGAAAWPVAKEIIRGVIRSHLDEVRVCYEHELAKSPTAEGRVLVQFAITGSGHVVASKVEESTLDDPAVGDCITDVLRRWRFPRPCDGRVVKISYPFVLKVAGGAP